VTETQHGDWPTSISPSKDSPPANSVGIVIPMRDNLKFFKLAFHSVLSFTDYPYMLTVVDNMSSMSTRTYLRSIQKNHPINVLHYQEDFNFSAEVNLGLRYLMSNPNIKYGLILNSDTVVEPGWLSTLVKIINSNDKWGILGPVTNIAIPAQEKPKNRDLYVADYVSGFCMMFKRKVFEQLDGFDQDYAGGCYEDRDFCYRANKAGWRSLITGSVYVHHFWKATRRKDMLADKQVIVNRQRFFNKFPELKTDKKVAV